MFETPYTNIALSIIPLCLAIILGISLTIKRFKERRTRIKHILMVIEGGKNDE